MTGSTPNEYLYTGEGFDANTGFYYLRARYLNPATGRFLTMDTYGGSVFKPLTLHKYLYVQADPVNHVDRTGLFLEMAFAGAEAGRLDAGNAQAALAAGALLRWLLTALGIGTIAITAVEVARRIEFFIRLHHYTDLTGLGHVLAGGINSRGEPTDSRPASTGSMIRLRKDWLSVSNWMSPSRWTSTYRRTASASRPPSSRRCSATRLPTEAGPGEPRRVAAGR